MYIDSSHRRSGWTLIEMMVAVAVFSIGAAALGSTFLFSIRSMAALSNYTALDKMNQQAMDAITREIRQSKMIVSYETNALEIVNGEGATVRYMFSEGTERFYRGILQPYGWFRYEVVLDDCNLINFRVGQRNLQRCPTGW